jgi:glycosyltransferase involved in cell wall biosynthesis
MTQLSVAIPSYGREEVLVDSIHALLALEPPPWELLLIDQTPRHTVAVEEQLGRWQQEGRLRWLRQQPPSITQAMNRALLEARGDRVLFVDDDIVPSAELLTAHIQAGHLHPETLIAGRVLQRWHQGQADAESQQPFSWNTLQPRPCRDFIGCNFSVPRLAAIRLGGFDNNFVQVAYNYEAEFAHRWRQAGHPIEYVPTALVHHLQTEQGGTRSYGKRVISLKPAHAVGRYYFFLRTRALPLALVRGMVAMARTVRTRHHLRKPWWIPVTLIAETRGLLWALKLHLRGAQLLRSPRPRLLVAASHPVQYLSPLLRQLAADPALDLEVLYLTLPDASTQGVGFGRSFTWDVPLLDGYRWRQARSGAGAGIASSYAGVRLRRPWAELGFGGGQRSPDVLLLTGWHVLGLLQLLCAARLRGIPVILRMDSNDQRRRSLPQRLFHRMLFRQVAIGLPVGEANKRLYLQHGLPEQRLIRSPHFIDNARFAHQAEQLRQDRAGLRQRWGIPDNAFCLLFAGKLQHKKRPLVLLQALALALGPEQKPVESNDPTLHLLIVGSGELESECQAFATLHSLPVSFAGFLNQSEIPAAYAASDALVLPSDDGETWGLVVNEAMSCGLPAIVSDQVGCAVDLVEPNRTGLVVPCDDPRALATALVRLARDPDHVARMGEAAQQRVHRDYSVVEAAAAVRLATLRLPPPRPDPREEDASKVSNDHLSIQDNNA